MLTVRNVLLLMLTTSKGLRNHSARHSASVRNLWSQTDDSGLLLHFPAFLPASSVRAQHCIDYRLSGKFGLAPISRIMTDLEARD